jgi:hypothetical protein
MEPWHKLVTPRKEVCEGRAFNPDEFAIHLEQIVNGTAPEDYKNLSPFLHVHVSQAAFRLTKYPSSTVM